VVYASLGVGHHALGLHDVRLLLLLLLLLHEGGGVGGGVRGAHVVERGGGVAALLVLGVVFAAVGRWGRGGRVGGSALVHSASSALRTSGDALRRSGMAPARLLLAYSRARARRRRTGGRDAPGDRAGSRRGPRSPWGRTACARSG